MLICHQIGLFSNLCLDLNIYTEGIKKDYPQTEQILATIHSLTVRQPA